ncbi:Bypass of stop codon protein 6 [Fusarium oxysporum f. sp. cubense]|uniref:Bypass of stop codon protein 6 n=1 Tax=Fusarium oxysporum f. sp. cubense TaxID=61366 RepID=A0A559LX32_FUSOC|nr:Bypass of stop codon protein 6 [Fusarium oxysporum f. sp. cubense]
MIPHSEKASRLDVERSYESTADQVHPFDTHEHDKSSQAKDCENATAPNPIRSIEIVEDLELQKWNYPKGNVPRLGFAFLSFIIAGMNDAAVGALVPYLEKYYDLNYTTVSLIFLTPFAGYAIAAFTNAHIHLRWGQRGVAILAPMCHVIAFTIVTIHPPFPALVVLYGLSGFGNGLADAAYCAWVGAMDKSNQIQGFMHSCYSLGALCAPLISTSMVVHSGLPWYSFFYVMIGISAVEWAGLMLTFWRKTGAVYRAENPAGGEDTGAVGLGGWIVTFMLRTRKATAFAAGVSGSGFWAGQTLGRAALGFVTERYGERICITIYLAFAVAMQLIFWLVPSFMASAIAVVFLGVFLGPMFPGAITVTAKLLPKHIHVSAMGFAMSMGGTGGTIFPFIIGPLASKYGVWAMQPFILGLLIVIAATWFSFPRISR